MPDRALAQDDVGPSIRVAQAHALNDAAMRAWGAGQDPTAIAMLRRAIALAPDKHEMVGNLGLVLWRMGAVDEAGMLLRHAAALAPDMAMTHGNLGVYYSGVMDHAKADYHLFRAADLAPDKPGPVWDRAIGLLERGDWGEGWIGYERRLTMSEDRRHYPRFPVPLWAGESLDGKTILIRGEQGVGDRMQFARYIPEIKRRWPTCRILFCPYDDLLNLLWGYRDVCELLPVGVPFPDGVDFGAFLCSIPGRLGARPDNIVADPGYIKARIMRQHVKAPAALPLPHLPSLKVGIVWTGNPAHMRNRDRSIPLDLLLPLAEDPRITLYGFQVGPGANDIGALGCSDIVNPLGRMLAAEGWVGTGLALLQLDILVTVDTAVAHLAGALDVPTLLMLPHHAEWRWGQRGPATSWYPSLTLVRQADHGDWMGVIRRVKKRLARLATERLDKGT